MKLNKRIRTVLYGDQRFSAAELELLHTPAFQRLYDLHQLGLTDRVFIDASHSRLHHVVGVVEQATNLMESLARNLRTRPLVPLEYSGGPRNPIPTSGQFASLVTRRIPAGRLMALLHDLTHAPYGHTLEDEIRLVEEKHDEPARQAEAFYRVAVQFFGWLMRNSLTISATTGAPPTREEEEHARHLSQYLDWPEFVDLRKDTPFITFLAQKVAGLILTADERRTKQPFLKLGTKELTQFVKQLAFAMRALLFLEAAHKEELQLKHVPESSYAFDQLFAAIFEVLHVAHSAEDIFVPHRDAFMLDVIGNTICADLLDYAKRDAVNAGLKLDYDATRIIQNFTLISHISNSAQVSGEAVPHPFEHHSIRTAISLFGHKLRLDVAGELLNLLQVRYYVYERMLFHPTKCIAGAMLGAAVQLAGWKYLPVHFRQIGDAVFLNDARNAAQVVIALFESLPDGPGPYTPQIRDSLKSRLAQVPLTSVSIAAMELLDDRLVRLDDAKSKLEHFRHLRTFREVVDALLQAIAATGYVADRVLDEEAKSSILSRLPQGSAELRERAERLLTLVAPNISGIMADIRASLRLFSRLTSRKFFKSVFRLLPNLTVLNAKGINAAVIAKQFQDSTIRDVAEREIERRSSLPVGTVVIHCPSADGPKKMANILITPGIVDEGKGHPEAVPLHSIGNLHPPIFQKHQKAIEALQDMYKSMWRLVVSVAPPHTIHWDAISKASGDVVYEILTRGDDAGGPAENDKYMKVEIETSLHSVGKDASAQRASVQMPDGTELDIPLARFQFLQEVGTILESVDGFGGVMNMDSVDDDAMRAGLLQFRSLIENRRTTATPATVIDGDQPLPDLATSEDLEGELDSVLALYKPTIAENQWEEIMTFRAAFIANARTNRNRRHIVKELRTFRFTSRLMPHENVESNNATAESVMSELSKLL